MKATLKLALVFILTIAVEANAGMIFTFDSDEEGFTADFDGSLGTLEYRATGGNTGGYITVIDNISGGGNLPVNVPLSISNLSQYAGFQFDQLLPSSAQFGVGVRIEATNGDFWAIRSAVTSASTWATINISFSDLSGWVAGNNNTEAFNFALANVEKFQLIMEVSEGVGGAEGGVDNVIFGEHQLVSEPSTFLLFGIGGALFVLGKRRRTSSLIP